jgi:hypothetical protein
VRSCSSSRAALPCSGHSSRSTHSSLSLCPCSASPCIRSCIHIGHTGKRRGQDELLLRCKTRCHEPLTDCVRRRISRRISRCDHGSTALRTEYSRHKRRVDEDGNDIYRWCEDRFCGRGRLSADTPLKHLTGNHSADGGAYERRAARDRRAGDTEVSGVRDRGSHRG